VEDNVARLREAGADEVETSLLEMRNRLNAWLPVLEVIEEKNNRPKPAILQKV
jgi:hypothetical protein